VLVAGSTVATDCGIAKETADICCLAVFSADTLELIALLNCEKGVRIVTVAGSVNEDEYLIFMNGSARNAYVMDISKVLSEGKITCAPAEFSMPDGWYIHAERDGYFVHGANGKVDLVRVANNKCESVKVVIENNNYRRGFVSNGYLLASTYTTIDMFKIFD